MLSHFCSHFKELKIAQSVLEVFGPVTFGSFSNHWITATPRLLIFLISMRTFLNILTVFLCLRI